LASCKNTKDSGGSESFSQVVNFQPDEGFEDYWYSGKAELNSYELDINRYGQSRTGDVVMVFVTEGFSKSKQVKLDAPQQAGKDMVTIMKLNHIQKFKTGIYDYSMINSVFTPVSLSQHPYTLKTTCSVQDWCGHTFTQLNREKEGFHFREYSYFEQEGDTEAKLSADLLEDELFTRLRINPKTVPVGEVNIIPGNFFSRLSHLKVAPKQARIRFEESEATTQCIIEYLHLDRTVRINFESIFPYRILSYSEERSRETMLKATLRTTIQSAYWQQNGNRFTSWRDSLQLTY
jgi:hypothetical protein